MMTISEQIKLLEQAIDCNKRVIEDLRSNQKPVTPSSKYTILIDEGHGSINPQGIYTTAGKFWDHKKGQFHEGSIFYEGVFNRIIGTKLAQKFEENGIYYKKLAHQYNDTPLSERTEVANAYHTYQRKSIIVSIHANATDTQTRGYSIWTSPGQTESDKIAERIWGNVENSLGKKITMMSQQAYDGDRDYEAAFWMLKHSISPAILIEHLFFDNYQDAKLLMKEEIQNAFVDTILEGCIWAMDNIIIEN